MTTKSLDRRTVLRGLLATGGAVTIPLPLLEIMLNDYGAALAQTDAALVQACAEWGPACPADLVIPVTFAGDALAQPAPVLPARADGLVAAQPLVFALAPGLTPDGVRPASSP